MKAKMIYIGLLALVFGGISNAQFSHDFSSTSNLNPFSTPYYTSNSGCFMVGNGSVYDANLDGVLPDLSYLQMMMPVMQLNTGYVITIELTAASSNSVDAYLVTPGGSFNHIQTVHFTGSSQRQTITVHSGAASGFYRPHIVIRNLIGGGTLVLHSINITNATYTAPSTGCNVSTVAPCADTDSDGVCDDVDDYPNDPTKAYSSVVPSTTFMYEDLFPAYGDFDFNDLVVSAKREAITDADNDLRYLVIEAQVKAAGGSIAQGWGLELNGINPSDVVSVNGSDVSGNVMMLGANGTENGQTHAVIPVFDNVNKVITWGGGSFFNTVAGDPVGTGDIITVTIEFAKNSNLALADLNYNFFSFRTTDRSHEIHEIGMAPTSLADVSLFGTMADATNLNSGDTYVSVDGFPWAISTSATDYAVEKTDIVEAFLKFASWAQSGGNSYQDWHTNTTEGTYRNSAKIY
ncbi:hypothetical protein Oweho_1464 [Owenweeksia hongkongensis DSM 17368]|uniref:DUF4842 domain-containing protein n=1 Tax=Owenweeksia hongkongensis (strain DSM 17368 / CIP 108786 / JCM 12287 / NRRL B-23963 / UST20020801) TaxID=926562 RepID=G8R892_OWEHD|nr:LruC domain-containing protein [Owenweeksia hongkongensis]AEV32460.1 hypothetical protein Oweho_1464 [Owenweeksia hongkongensis DSM 17368]